MLRVNQLAAPSVVALVLLSSCDKAEDELVPRSVAAASAAGATAAGEATKIDFTGTAMGTKIQFVAFTNESVDENGVRRAMQDAFREMQRLEALMSSWTDTSEISEINRRAGDPVGVSRETFDVFEKSLWAGRISDGAFDVSFNVMSELWKFGDASEAEPRVPSRKLIEERKRHIDFRRIALDSRENTVTIGKDMKVGLGGIAKGYIVDRAAAVLEDRGVSAFLVQAGGDLFGAGKKPNGERWVSGIQDPRSNQGEYFATIQLEDHAFSTAGDYARAFIVDGKRYHHIIDPRTGYPATASRSVTVWAPDALTADAVDDAVFIMGPEKGLALIESLPGVGAVIVDEHNRVHVSRRLEGKVRIIRPPSEGP